MGKAHTSKSQALPVCSRLLAVYFFIDDFRLESWYDWNGKFEPSADVMEGGEILSLNETTCNKRMQ